MTSLMGTDYIIEMEDRNGSKAKPQSFQRILWM